MNDFIERLASGLPLTFIGGLAVVVMFAWLVGGVGPVLLRRTVAVAWLALLLACWGTVLYAEPTTKTENILLGATLGITLASFLVPVLWRRIFGKRNST